MKPTESHWLRTVPRAAGIATLAYVVVWLGIVADWMWFGQLPAAVTAVVAALSVPIGIGWIRWALQPERRSDLLLSLTGSLIYPFWWHALLMTTVLLEQKWEFWSTVRARTAQLGTAALFIIGLAWMVWLLERGSTWYATRHGRMDDSDADLPRDPDETPHELRAARLPEPIEPHPAWHPLNLQAWYFNFSLMDWLLFTAVVVLLTAAAFLSPSRLALIPLALGAVLLLPAAVRVVRLLRRPEVRQEGRPRRKLNQSLSGLMGYSLSFMLAYIVMTQVGGCSEVFELPAGGGEQKQIAQKVKIQKVIRRKFVINPFSAIRFKIPPIDEVKLQLTEITEHAYTVGYGQGTGAGYAGGTKAGKVRFIRLEYAGGDWDQDFGVGADLNMLVEYGIRTNQTVAERTESRRITDLRNFDIGKAPAFVFMTGQKNIVLSSREVKILQEYLLEKHGMIFCDNGGSRQFHNQFIAMMNRVLPTVRPVAIPLDDVIHRIPFPIPFLPFVAPHGGHEALGWKVDGRWVVYYHPGDINDAWTDDHSGVKPEIWEACYRLGANVMQYANAEYSKWLQARQQKD